MASHRFQRENSNSPGFEQLTPKFEKKAVEKGSRLIAEASVSKLYEAGIRSLYVVG